MPAISGTQKAPTYNLSGVGRAGATRSGYYKPCLQMTIAGVQRRTAIIAESLTITQALDDLPDTCAFTTNGSFTPVTGQEVVIWIGSTSHPGGAPIFAGHIIRTTPTTLSERLTTDVMQVQAIDYTWLLNRIKVNARYTSQSATSILTSLITTYAGDFSTARIAAALPSIDEITFTQEDLTDALTRVMRRIGGYWYADTLKVIHAFVGQEAGLIPPMVLGPSNPTLRQLSVDEDLAPVRTRVLFEGGGSTARGPVAVGATFIPVDSLAFFNPQGGSIWTGRQRVAYSSISSAQIPTAPTVQPSAGSGVETGVHGYAFTWITAAGESLPSPTASVDVGHQVANPTSAPTVQNNAAPNFGHTVWTAGVPLYLVVTYLNAVGETVASAASNIITTLQAFGDFQRDIDALAVPVSPDATVTQKKIYVNANGSWVANGTVSNAQTFFSFLIFNSVVQVSSTAPPSSNTTASNRVAVSAIAVGPTGVTQRKVYRTIAGGAQLKLLTTIADNTTLTYTDSTADASLGANAPVADSSGLALQAITSTNGSTAIGATSMTVLSTAGFPTSGVLLLSETMLTYTGVTATTFTGIPASGTGSVISTIPTGTEVQAANCLQGIPPSAQLSIVDPIAQGDDINVYITVEDNVAQAALAAKIGGTDTGIREEFFQDRRLSITEVTARATAFLTLRKNPRLTARFQVRDVHALVGATIQLPTDVTFPYPAGTFKIQDVYLHEFSAAGTYCPMRDVVASSERFSFEDLLRQIESA